jgi:two-component system phosphate regulon sensor histidine kinase PhoR
MSDSRPTTHIGTLLEAAPSPLGHRLAQKIGLSAGGGMLVLSLLLTFLWDAWTIGISAVAVLGCGLGAYVATFHHASKRLELARQVLKNIRKYDFQALDLAQVDRGDELNDIIRQVYRTGRVLEREFSELKKMETYRRDFLGNISHELKTPIFSIRGFAETLKDGALEDPAVNRSFVEKIIRNADRLSNLARDLSEIARLETGQLEMEKSAFSMKRLVNDVVDSVEPQAKKRAVSLKTSFERKLPPVYGDPSQIRQVVVNLVENAIKYSNEESTVSIRLRTRRKRGVVECSVKDQGIGVAKEDLVRLTERFFRVDKSRSRSAGGTGLGLSIVKHILAAHDQELSVSSALGKGSTFSFLLSAAHIDEEHSYD